MSYRILDLNTHRFVWSREVLVSTSWGMRNRKEAGDPIVITDPEGKNPSDVLIIGTYESTRPGEDLTSLPDLDHLTATQSQGKISLKKGKNFQDSILDNLPAGLVMDDFSQQTASEKDGLVQFAVPFFMMLILSFSFFILIYCRILVQQKRKMMDELQFLESLSGAFRKRRVLCFLLL